MAEEEKKSCNCLWWVIGIVILLGIIFFLYQYTLSLQKAREIAEQNLAAANNKLAITKTDLGYLSERYVMISNANDSLRKVLEAKDQELIVYQEVNASLELELQSIKVPVIQTSPNKMSIPLYNTYADKGLTLSISDTINLSRANTDAPWFATSSPSIDAMIYYRMMIFRDEAGFISASVETLSPYLKVTKLSTSFTDKYIPPPCTDEFPSVLAFTLGGSVNYVDVGMLVRMGKWAVNPSYIFVMNNSLEDPTWYDRLRLNLGYFVW